MMCGESVHLKKKKKHEKFVYKKEKLRNEKKKSGLKVQIRLDYKMKLCKLITSNSIVSFV